MGVKQSCELDHMANLCDMHTCIEYIEGRASHSASDTDTWVASLMRGTTFNGQPITHAFFKIGVNPASIRIQPGEADTFLQRQAEFAKRMRSSLGLRYEFQVYDRIIRPILDNDVCPLFLRPYLTTYNCRYKDLHAALLEGLDNQPPAKVGVALNRNLSFIMKGPKPKPVEGAKAAEDAKAPEQKPEKRPAIHVMPPDDEHFERPSPDVRYMVLTTEYTRPSTYYDFLRQVSDQYDTISVIMQILVALYTMEQSRLMHNDLHGLNILIQNYGDNTVTDTYEIEDIPPFSMSIQYRVKVFDFDHASCDFLGENPLWLTDGFEPNKDLACLYRWILSVGQPMIKRTHIDELFDTSKIVADYKKATADVKKDPHWCDAKGTQITRSILDALRQISFDVNNQTPVDPSGFPYIINRDVFMQSGEIYKDHRSKTRLRENQEYFKRTTKSCIDELTKCEQERNALKNRLAEMEANVRQLKRVIHKGPLRAFPKIQRPHR